MELPQIALDFSESVEEKLRQVEAFRSVTATYLVPFVGELSGIYRRAPFFIVVGSKLFPNNNDQRRTAAFLAIGRHRSHSTWSRLRGLKFFFRLVVARRAYQSSFTYPLREGVRRLYVDSR